MSRATAMDPLTQARQTGEAFILVQCEAGPLFLNLSDTANNVHDRHRNIDNARRTLATVDRYLATIRFDPDQAARLHSVRDRLAGRLREHDGDDERSVGRMEAG
jgi:hypothetical protein